MNVFQMSYEVHLMTMKANVLMNMRFDLLFLPPFYDEISCW